MSEIIEKIKAALGIELIGNCNKNHEDIRINWVSTFNIKDKHYEQCRIGFAAVSENGEVEIITHYHTGNYLPGKTNKDTALEVVYMPLSNDTLKMGQLTLPYKPEKCSGLSEILKEIEEKTTKWLYVSPEELPIFRVQLRLAVASWFLFVYEDITIQERVAGLLGIVGTSGGGKKRWLTILRQIAYRPIYLLNTSKIPSVFRMAEPWGTPTLLIDEADQKETGSEAEWVQFVNSRYDGTPIPRYNASTGQTETFMSFGLTALALRRMPKDEGTTGRMTKINATISPIALPEVAGNDIFQEFESIRNKLFYLRLKYYGKLKFVGSSGLPAEQSWRGKETLTLFRILEQIDPTISEDITNIGKALTKREVQNLAQTWDGLIINEIYAFISEDGAAPEKKNMGYYYYKIWERDGNEHRAYLNLKYLADRLGTSASEIQRSFAQFKISTYERFRPDGVGKPQRGILMFMFPEDTDRIFMRYVPEYAHELLKLTDLQKKLLDLESIGQKYADDQKDDDPHVPHVPPHDIPNDLSNNNTHIHVGGTCGTAGTENAKKGKTNAALDGTCGTEKTLKSDEKITNNSSTSDVQSKKSETYRYIVLKDFSIYGHTYPPGTEFEHTTYFKDELKVGTLRLVPLQDALDRAKVEWLKNPRKFLFNFVEKEASGTKYHSLTPKAIRDMFPVPDVDLSTIYELCEELTKEGVFLKNKANAYSVNAEFVNGGIRDFFDKGDSK
ncbi:MAG: hypothetical protein M1477_00795 [Candidatus Thermoplasmatota archaeon]|nr:hypothetical protein [Candidatus Thermoplasmatota archaeon]